MNHYENKVRGVSNYQREYENIESKYRDSTRKDILLKEKINKLMIYKNLLILCKKVEILDLIVLIEI